MHRRHAFFLWKKVPEGRMMHKNGEAHLINPLPLEGGGPEGRGLANLHR